MDRLFRRKIDNVVLELLAFRNLSNVYYTVQMHIIPSLVCTAVGYMERA